MTEINKGTGEQADVIRAALDAIYSGSEGTNSYLLPPELQLPAKAALASLEARCETAERELQGALDGEESQRRRAVAAEARVASLEAERDALVRALEQITALGPSTTGVRSSPGLMADLARAALGARLAQAEQGTAGTGDGQSPNDRCDKCGTHISEWKTKPCVRSLTQSPRHTITRFHLPDVNERKRHECPRCGSDEWEWIDYGGCSVCRSQEDRAAEDAEREEGRDK